MKRSSIRHCFFLAVVISTASIVLLGFVLTRLSDIGFFDKKSVETASLEQSKEVVTPIVDEAPDLQLLGDKIIKLMNIEDYVEPGFEANDDFDGNLDDSVQTEMIQIDDNDYQIQYTVQDSADNISTETREICIVEGIVCLTFDDGPSFEVTPQILDILKEKGVNATFFVNGYSDDKASIIKREDEEGNVVALHGYSHTYSEIYTDIDTLMNNFYKIEDLINETIGKDCKIIRFPGGASNTISSKYCEGIMTEAVQRVVDEGYIYVDWNVDSNDAGKDATNSDAIYENVTQGLKPGRTNVVLMHDRAEKQATVDALSGIIDYCIENNYDIQVITPETSLNSSQHHPNN